MATGSGKTYTAVNFIYRLVKYAGAKRVLFLVDRGNLGRQTLKEFQQFVSPVNNYKFTEEYIVQHLFWSANTSPRCRTKNSSPPNWRRRASNWRLGNPTMQAKPPRWPKTPCPTASNAPRPKRHDQTREENRGFRG